MRTEVASCELRVASMVAGARPPLTPSPLSPRLRVPASPRPPLAFANPPLAPSPLRPPSLSPRPRVPASRFDLAHRTPRRGFTLVEMLVVMAVIVLAITMAIPAIRFLTGSRSQQAAANTIGGILGYARNDAMRLQDYRGVLFFLGDDGRVSCYEVQKSTDQFSISDLPGVIYLDLAGAEYPPSGSPVPAAASDITDPVILPPGIRLWTLNDCDRIAPKYVGYNYLGMNPPADFVQTGSTRTDVRIGGVILFGPDGKLVSRRYGFRFVRQSVIWNASGPATAGTPVLTALGQLIAADLTTPFPQPVWPIKPEILYSSIGLVTCDKEEMRTNLGDATEGNDDIGATKSNTYFDSNTTPLFVNRYSGTLMQAE